MKKMNKHKTISFRLVICFLSLFVVLTPAFASSEKASIKENIATLKKTKACPGCDLKGAVLDRMDLSGANLEGAYLDDAKLYLVDLSKANLRNAHLERAIFGGADLAEADLRGANLNGADLSTAYTAGAKFDGEFIKTKPYEKDGLPEIEKKTYVDDTVRPKKIDEKYSGQKKEADVSKSLTNGEKQGTA